MFVVLEKGYNRHGLDVLKKHSGYVGERMVNRELPGRR